MEDHFPWKNLGDGRLYLIGLDDTRMARVWREAMEAHGIQGDAIDSAQMKTWTPARTQRTKIVVQRPNPWPERLRSLAGKLSAALGTLGKGLGGLLLFGVLGIGALILLAKRRRTPPPPRRAAARAPTRPQALQTRRSTNTPRGPAGRPPPRLSVH